MDGESVCDLLTKEKVNFAAGVPTVWLMLLNYLHSHKKTLPDLKVNACTTLHFPASDIDSPHPRPPSPFLHTHTVLCLWIGSVVVKPLATLMHRPTPHQCFTCA
jgi:hypothetical protein